MSNTLTVATAAAKTTGAIVIRPIATAIHRMATIIRVPYPSYAYGYSTHAYQSYGYGWPW